MTTTATPTKPSLRFGFAPRPAVTAAGAPVDVPAAERTEPTSTTTQQIATSNAPTQQPDAVENAVGAQFGTGVAGDPLGTSTEDVTVMLQSGGRQGQVFGGVFGRMEGGKFRTDPLLKSIYLLELMDGAEPGGAPITGTDERGELLARMGGMPEVVTIAVPTDLVASFKATLAHLCGERWQRLYAGAASGVQPMIQHALQNEARVARETVAQIERTGGEVFTVQVSEPKALRFMMVAGDDEYDGFGRELEGVAEEVVGTPVVTVVAGAPAEAVVGQETLASACSGRQEGDTVTYRSTELHTVIAESPEAAINVRSLLPPSLENRWLTASDVMVNGQPYVLAGPLLEEMSATAEVPR